MAVTVITGLYDGAPGEGAHYADANHFFEKDGHLYVVVSQTEQNVQAIYSPNSWSFAYLGEKIQFKRDEFTA